MKIIHTDQISPDDLSPWEREQVYNGLDVCVTAEVLEALLPQLDNVTSSTYAFSRSLQGPLLEMRLRGVLVDQERKAQVIEEYYEKIELLQSNLERIAGEGLGLWDFNWRSNADLHHLFYDILRIPPVRYGGKPTVNRAALEKLEAYMVARPIVKHMLAMRDLGKKISVLKTEIDNDGRMRTSYNIAGTSTGRLSSSFSEFGTGGNLQNVEESLRSIFISDPGMKMAYFDAEQGESRVVGAIEGNLFDDWRYLDACESGDLHTYVATLVWPELPWTGDLKADRALAEQVYYRHYDRRFMCKKLGHGTNYGGKPRALAAQAKVEVDLVEEFQPKYFSAFPAHLHWHRWTRDELHTNGYIISLTGRKRWFFGRREADDTFREAVAFQGQALVDIVNNGLLRVWYSDIGIPYMHDHDAVTIMYPEEKEDEIIPQLLDQLRYPIPLEHGRELVIPYGCKTGWNKGEWNETNPDGLKSYKPGDKRKRSEKVGILDRKLHRVHK